MWTPHNTMKVQDFRIVIIDYKMGNLNSVKNALGQLISLPNNGLLDILDIGIDLSGQIQIGVKLGGQSDNQTIWINVNVQAAPPPPKVLLMLHGMNSNTNTWDAFVAANFGGSSADIRDGAIVGSPPTPNAQGVYCYRLQFVRASQWVFCR